MKILYYYWMENSADDMIMTLKKMEHEVNRITLSFDDYECDENFVMQLREFLRNDKYDLIFSFDFFPLISKVAQDAEIPYASWIYDMPHLTLFSPQLKNEMNYVFVFDYSLYNTLKEKDYPCHLYHLPLAVNTDRMIEMLGAASLNNGKRYAVSFVGSLYENCLYNQINYLPDYLREYLELGIKLQRSSYEHNYVTEVLTEDIAKQLEKWVKLGIPKDYALTYKDMFANIYNAKITSEDRINLMNKVADRFPFVLYTGSNQGLVPNASFGGIVDYVKETPKVFRNSKINLNITLRSIVSGIPLRALAIMGAGGFLMSNYQPELAEYFTEDEECVLFRSEEDMLEKTEYYLGHEKERVEIACNGFRKVRQKFAYEIQVEKILKEISKKV